MVDKNIETIYHVLLAKNVKADDLILIPSYWDNVRPMWAKKNSDFHKVAVYVGRTAYLIQDYLDKQQPVIKKNIFKRIFGIK